MTVTNKTPSLKKHRRRVTREVQSANGREAAATLPATDPAPSPANPASKTSLVLELLQRPAGATIAQLAEATSWLPHTTRAALTGLKKKGHEVTSSKAAGEERVYRVAAS